LPDQAQRIGGAAARSPTAPWAAGPIVSAWNGVKTRVPGPCRAAPTGRAAVMAGTGPQPDPTALIGPRCRVKAGRNGPAAKLPGLAGAAQSWPGQAI